LGRGRCYATPYYLPKPSVTAGTLGKINIELIVKYIDNSNEYLYNNLGEQRPMFTNPNLEQNLFKGTSKYYSQYRFSYIQEMIDDILKIIKVEQNDKLLDLACGPGRLSIPLSKYFNEVYAIDWEKEMIDEGEKISNNLCIKNIKWINDKAENLDIDHNFFKLITIGDAFHRMDQIKILQNSHRMLKKGGHLALIYSGTIDNGNTEWQKELKKVISPWKKVNIQSNDNFKQPWDLFLKETNYINVTFREFEEIIFVNLETIIGYLYSMSVYTKNIIGDKYQLFENEIREKLMEIEPKNNFEFNFKCGYYIGEKK
jgi:ubiquinone/menaquinone biosynthesis C-methylase UbiE